MNEILDAENHKTYREPAAPSTVPAPGLTPSRSALKPADCSCGGAVDTKPEPQDLGHVYAIGTVAPRFPTLGLEKELAQAVKGAETANLTDGQVLHDVLCRPENRYLAREMCWVFAVEGIDTYLLEPRSEHELDQLITTVRPDTGLDVDVVIGSRGSVAPPDRCNGLMLPTVMCDQVFTFDVDSFIDTIPRPASITEDAFGDAARELFFRVMQLTDNVGSEPEHRAINYLTLRYPAVYALVMDMYAADKSLVGVDVHPSRLSLHRDIVQVIFSFVDRKTDVTEKFFARVDVTEKWIFLVSKLSPFYDR